MLAPPTLAAWLHDLSPFVIQFSPSFGIRWYGMAYATSFLLAWLMLRWLAARGATAIPRERAGDAILYGVAGVVLGGRLGYVLIYQQSLLWTFTSTAPWWGVLAINQGGMAYHGGLLGVIISTWFIARMAQQSARQRVGPDHPAARLGRGAMMLHILDGFALLTPGGLMLGRIANFVNGELLGRVVTLPGEPAPWWAVKFPQEVPDEYLRWEGVLRDRPPVQTGEQLQQIRALTETVAPGQGFEAGYRRVVDLIQHGNHELARKLEPLLAARHPSQLYQAALEGVVAGLVVWAIAARPRRPGVVGGWFIISYGVVRIIAEAFWRLPDAGAIPQYVYGLTKGQWLSAGMIGAGLIGLALVHKRRLPPMGGWLHPSLGPAR